VQHTLELRNNAFRVALPPALFNLTVPQVVPASLSGA
jgi:hypothetical protein